MEHKNINEDTKKEICHIGKELASGHIWFDVPSPNPSFIGRTAELQAIYDNFHTEHVLVILGINGVGKSELAVKYAHNYANFYEHNVIWINATNRFSLKTSFCLLMERLQITIKNIDDEEINLNSIISNTYARLKSIKSLVIFDNVEDIDGIINLLPPNPTNNVLIITCNLGLHTYKNISLKSLESDEAIEFVNKSLHVVDFQEDVEKLINLLYNFPLSLQLAVIYIQIENITNPEFEIRNYVELYEAMLLNSKLSENVENLHVKTVFISFNLLMNKLKRDPQYNNKILEIINIAGYLPSENICTKLFLKLVDDIDFLNVLLQLINQYNIFKKEKNAFTIHHLIQQAIRTNLINANEEQHVLKEIYLLLNKDIKYYGSHIASFWNYIYQYDNLVNDFIINNDDKEDIIAILNLLLENGADKVAKYILESIEQKNSTKVKELIDIVDMYGKGILHNAVICGSEALVSFLVEKGCNVNATTNLYRTALHFASDYGYLNIVDILLDNRALVNSKTESMYTSLHLAAQNGFSDIVKLLLKKGAGINNLTNKKYTPLHLATENNHVDTVKTLLEDDRININAATEENVTALHIAAQNGYFSIVSSLLDDSCLAPLSVDTTGTSIQSTIDINVKTNKGNTPLHLAVLNNQKVIVEALLKNNADFKIKNNNNKSPQDLTEDIDIKNIFEEHILTTMSILDTKSAENDAEKPMESTLYNKRQGTSGISGQLYEIELSMLFLLHGITNTTNNKIDGFYLATNMVEGGDFDDVVFKSFMNSEDTEKLNVIFLQAKHKEAVEKDKDKKINIHTLLSKSEKGDFILRKYLSAYNKIQQQFKKNLNHPIFKDGLDDCEIIIYTNAIIDLKRTGNNAIKENEYQEHALYIRQLPEDNFYYKLNDTTDVLNFLKPSLDYEILVKELTQSIINETIDMNKPIFADYHITLAETIIEQIDNKREGVLRESFFDNADEFRDEVLEGIQKKKSNLKGKSKDVLKEELRKIRLQLPEKFGDKGNNNLHLVLPKKYFTDEEVKVFLKKLKLYVAQPNEAQLGEIIKEKIKVIYQVEPNDIDSVFSEVEYKIRKWWKEGKVYLKENSSFFHQAARISVLFDIREPVTLFTGRIGKLDELHQTLHNGGRVVISQIASVTGLGGVGKSELARKYISMHSKEYDNNIIWINADDHFSISDSFRRLAEKLEINTAARNGKEKDLKVIIKEIYDYFAKRHRKSLFIFDNADRHKTYKTKDEALDKYLPSNRSKTYVIITSRNQEWGDIKPVTLDVFNEDEAEEFIKKALSILDDSQDTEIKDLARTLQYLPLALRQAVAYIKKENESSKLWRKEVFTINNYIEQFNKEAAAFLESETKLENSDNYTKTVFTTWKITIKKIGTKICGKQALHLLHMMAYFAPDKISIEGIFLENEEKEEELHNAVELLNQYSMAILDQGELFIHRLVQQVTRIELRKEDKERDVLNNALALLKKTMFTSSFTGSIHTFHAVSAWDYASNYQELVKTFSRLPSSILIKLYDGVRYEEGCTFGKRATKQLTDVLSADHFSTLNTKQNTAGILLNQGKYDEALEEFEEVFNKERREDILGENHPITLNTKNNIAMTLYRKGKYKDALQAFQEVFKMQETVLGPKHHITLNTKSNIAALLEVRGKYIEAIKVYEEVLTTQNQEVLGSNHPGTLTTKNNIASLYNKLGQFDKAQEILQEVFDKRKNILGPNNPDTLTARHNLADVLKNLGKLDEALQIFREVLDNKKEMLGLEHPSTLNTENSIIEVLFEKGDYNIAMKSAEEVLNKRTTHLGPNHPDTLSAKNNKAKILDKQGKYIEALRMFEEIYEKLGNSLSFDHPDVISLKYNIAGILEKLARYDKALIIYEEIVHNFNDIFGPNHPDTLLVHRQIAKTLGQQGKYEEALSMYLDVVDKYKKIIGENRTEYLTLKNDLAWILYQLGMYDDALHMYQETLIKLESNLESDHITILGVKNNIAGVLDKQCKYNEALQMYLEILSKYEGILGSDHPNTLTIKNNIALLYKNQGEYQKALNIYQEVFDKRENILGPSHPTTLGVKINIAGVYAAQRRFPEALVVLLETVHKFKDPNHPLAIQMAQKIAGLQRYLASGGF